MAVKAVTKHIRIAPRKIRIVADLVRGKMDVAKLFISEIFVDQDSTMKRIHPRSRGQAFKILKHSSHLTVVVDEKA